MGLDVDQPGLDFRDPVRIVGGLGFPEQRIALEVRFQHDFDETLRPVRRLLCKTADAPARRNRNDPGLGRQFAANRLEQRRFAGTVAADQTDARAGHDLRGAVIDQKPSGDPDRYVGD
jgi:hypothetical protein